MGDLLGFVVMNLAFNCLVGCTSLQGPVPEVRLPPKPIVQAGYVVVPLNEAGWRVFRRTPTQLALAKEGRHADETITVQAGTYDARVESDPKLLERAEADTRDRFQLLESTSRPDERPTCIRRHLVTEDRAPVRRSGSKNAMILEAQMLTCTHPGDQALGVALMYSQRYDRGQRDPEFDAKAAELFKGLRFTEVASAR